MGSVYAYTSLFSGGERIVPKPYGVAFIEAAVILIALNEERCFCPGVKTGSEAHFTPLRNGLRGPFYAR